MDRQNFGHAIISNSEVFHNLIQIPPFPPTIALNEFAIGKLKEARLTLDNLPK